MSKPSDKRLRVFDVSAIATSVGKRGKATAKMTQEVSPLDVCRGLVTASRNVLEIAETLQGFIVENAELWQTIDAMHAELVSKRDALARAEGRAA